MLSLLNNDDKFEHVYKYNLNGQATEIGISK